VSAGSLCAVTRPAQASRKPIRKLRWSSVVAMVTALTGLLVAFGFPLSNAQSAAILAATVAFGPLVAFVVGYRVSADSEDFHQEG